MIRYNCKEAPVEMIEANTGYWVKYKDVHVIEAELTELHSQHNTELTELYSQHDSAMRMSIHAMEVMEYTILGLIVIVAFTCALLTR
jgi:hypothetical protein